MTDRIICNPVNLPYKFGAPFLHASSSRHMGDPSLILFKDRYYLFPSAQGFYHSEDMVNWTYVSGTGLPINFTAPDIREIDGWLYTGGSSREVESIYRTKDPLSGEWELVSRPFEFWDPNFFQDDDGRVYFYWGCSNEDPIWGVEMDKETMQPKGKRKVLIEGHPDIHGWERLGKDNDNNQGFTFPEEKEALPLTDVRPWTEGPWMTKHDGKYYLQFAAPGTEFNCYSDGVYVGEYPLGPFTYGDDNPLSTKPGGFIPGSGHGSTIQDKQGNWWHISTMIVAVNEAFERRVGLFPTGFDKDGVMFCNMNYSDYPVRLPETKIDDPWTDCFPGWMLLSYRKPVTVSSECTGHAKENIVDESIRTYWAAGTRAEGEQITVDLESVQDVHAIQINFADHNLGALFTVPGYRQGDMSPEEWADQKIQWLLEGSADGTHWETLCDKRQADSELSHDLVCLDEGKALRYIRLTGYRMPYHGLFAVSGLRVFGHAGGKAPAQATEILAKRTGPMDARITWKPVHDCDGYNVRWGASPEKLYHSFMLCGSEHESLDLRQLNDGVDCCIVVDTYNGSGITEGTCVRAK